MEQRTLFKVMDLVNKSLHFTARAAKVRTMASWFLIHWRQKWSFSEVFRDQWFHTSSRCIRSSRRLPPSLRPSTFALKRLIFLVFFFFGLQGIDDLRIAIYDVARNLQKSERGQVSVMGEKIPHSFLLVADVIDAKRQELRNNGKLPIMHKSEYEALVLDTIKSDVLDIEDTNDLVEVTNFMHERGKFEFLIGGLSSVL